MRESTRGKKVDEKVEKQPAVEETAKPQDPAEPEEAPADLQPAIKELQDSVEPTKNEAQGVPVKKTADMKKYKKAYQAPYMKLYNAWMRAGKPEGTFKAWKLKQVATQVTGP